MKTESRGLLSGFGRGYGCRFGDDRRIQAGLVHHPLDVESLVTYPLIIVDKSQRDWKDRTHQRLLRSFRTSIVSDGTAPILKKMRNLVR
jgi:hypothetical protein